MTITETSVIRFGTTQIAYKVCRSPRRKTVAVSVNPRLGVLVTAPQDVPLVRLDAIVRRKARWIIERRRGLHHIDGAPPPREFVSGESYLYLGRHYRLKVVRQEHPGDGTLMGGWLRVPSRRALEDQERARRIRKALESWYRRHAAEKLSQRAVVWAARVAIPAPQILIRDQQRRWGSCDARGVVRFNWRIIQASIKLVDYVVVHELVHLRYKNHTEDFWRHLGRLMPDYEARREALRRIGPRLEW